jgi:hypothetical protein
MTICYLFVTDGSTDDDGEDDGSIEEFNESSIVGLIDVVCIILSGNKTKFKTPQNVGFWDNIKSRFTKTCSLFLGIGQQCREPQGDFRYMKSGFLFLRHRDIYKMKMKSRLRSAKARSNYISFLLLQTLLGKINFTECSLALLLLKSKRVFGNFEGWSMSSVS